MTRLLRRRGVVARIRAYTETSPVVARIQAYTRSPR